MVDIIELDKKAGDKRRYWEIALNDFKTDLQDIDNGRDIPTEMLENNFQNLEKAQKDLKTALFPTP